MVLVLLTKNAYVPGENWYRLLAQLLEAVLYEEVTSFRSLETC